MRLEALGFWRVILPGPCSPGRRAMLAETPRGGPRPRSHGCWVGAKAEERHQLAGRGDRVVLARRRVMAEVLAQRRVMIRRGLCPALSSTSAPDCGATPHGATTPVALMQGAPTHSSPCPREGNVSSLGQQNRCTWNCSVRKCRSLGQLPAAWRYQTIRRGSGAIDTMRAYHQTPGEHAFKRAGAPRRRSTCGLFLPHPDREHHRLSASSGEKGHL